MSNITSSSRLSTIMALVDAWAVDGAGWDCRDEAEAEVRFILNARSEEFADWTDEQIAEAGINAWMEAE